MVAFICSATLDPSDQDFILQLYLEFKGLMYSTAQKYITSPQAVEDIVQDSIAKLINKVDILRNMELNCTQNNGQEQQRKGLTR